MDMQTLRSVVADVAPDTAEKPARRRGSHRARRRRGVLVAFVVTIGVVTATGSGVAASILFPTQPSGGTGQAAGTSTTAGSTPTTPAGLITQSPESSPTPEKTESSEPPEETDDGDSDSGEPEYGDEVTAVVDLVNQRRAEAGCGEVSIDDRLVAAADGHSEDMAANGYFDHTSQDGRSFGDRASAQGYDAAIGENIAAGQRTADEVMDAWMNSEGHRANILNCDAVAIGLGVADADDGTRYWTQLFGSQ